MRQYGFLATSIGVAGAAVLALAPALPAVAATTVRPATVGPEPAAEPAVTGADLLGGTQSLPLVPLPPDRTRSRVRSHARDRVRTHAWDRVRTHAWDRVRDRRPGAVRDQGLYRAHVRHFSLVGIVWDDPDAELHGSVRVRTRSAATGTWSAWQAVETRNADHGADPGTAERTTGRVRGATAPLWVGDSDGVEVYVRADTGDRNQDTAGTLPLPSGLRLELVDPGEDPPDPRTDQSRTGEPSEAASAANAALAPLGATEIHALDRGDTEREMLALRGDELTARQRAQPSIGARPGIVTRRGWGADESLRDRGFVYTKKIKAAFVHHTATGNDYGCSQAPSVIRGIYRYHVESMGWRDIGYNFLVDKCGTIYEGRAGGVAKPVLGAHTMGFNSDSMGIAVIGSYGTSKPSAAAVTALARLTAWKLGLYGMDPHGKTYLTSGGGNLFQKGKSVRLNVISGHRDGFATDCPGKKLYGKLGTARRAAARYQGR